MVDRCSQSVPNSSFSFAADERIARHKAAVLEDIFYGLGVLRQNGRQNNRVEPELQQAGVYSRRRVGGPVVSGALVENSFKAESAQGTGKLRSFGNSTSRNHESC